MALRANEINQRPELLDTLAAAYAANGQFNNAVQTASQAVEIAKEHGKIDLADRINNRLKLYQSNRNLIE